jgi:phosphatidylethanolamine-binding protein (PEBP) family uncharacterized protein
LPSVLLGFQAKQIEQNEVPGGNGFIHWAVYNIPASTTSFPDKCGRLRSRSRGWRMTSL